jgi:MFS family permease
MHESVNLRKSWYVIFILMLAYISSFIDRQVLALLVEPIKRDLAISDSQIALLHGASFAIFYTFMGIPLGRLADRRNRKIIIMIGILVWSIMTALCGIAHTFWWLFLARMGVGVGEAALSPAAYSMITDLFPKEKLGRAMGIYNIGVFLGSGLSILLVAWILTYVKIEGMWQLPIVGEVYPWQTVFFIVGLPGLIIVLIIWTTINEPTRKNVKHEQISNSQAISYFKDNKKVILAIYFGMACMAMATYSATFWMVTSLVRNYGMASSKAGVTFGLMVTVFSTAGVVFGGRYADALVRKGHLNGRLMVSYRGMFISVIITSLMMILVAVTGVPPLYLFLALSAIFCFTSSMPYAAAVAALQEVVPASMRGIFSAMFLFVVNLLGLGIGPNIASTINKILFKDNPPTIMVSMTIGMVIVCVLSSLALRSGLAGFARSIGNAKNS